MANGNGPWKTIAIALLTALLSGAGVLVLGAANRQPVPDLSDLQQRVAVTETRSQAVDARMGRLEEKVDRVLELLSRARP